MSNKLSNHVQNLLKAVKDNPLRYEELKSLYETDSPSPDYFQPQVLSAIFLPFHTSPPTSRPPLGHMPPQKDRLALLRGMSATQALQNILYHTEDGKTPPGFTLEVLADSHILPAWPAIFEWMKFLHYTTPYNISFDFSDIPFDPSARSLFNTHMLEAIITVIFLTRSPPNYEMNPLCTAVCRTRGVLPMALEIWIRQQELSSIDWRFSEALKSMMFFAGSPDVDELNRTGFKLGHANLASLLMRPLRFVTYSRPTDKRMQGFGATMQGYLAFSEPAPILFKALVDQGLMVDIMHGISSIMSLPAIPKVIGVTAMESAFILVHMSTFAMDANKKWLRAALRLKMIPLLAQFETTMKAAGTPAKTVASFTQRAFGDIFMPYIFHPGILLSLAEVMKSLSQDLPQAIKTLDGQWKAFSVGVDMVGKQVETFEKSGGFRLKCSLFRHSVIKESLISVSIPAVHVEKWSTALSLARNRIGKSVIATFAEHIVQNAMPSFASVRSGYLSMWSTARFIVVAHSVMQLTGYHKNGILTYSMSP
ncbi:hypothetical protein DXG01_007477 [Tephrocybe rancida]|nr:hypothetical protein DXG01_007477 [Tephrocybe rancida]